MRMRWTIAALWVCFSSPPSFGAQSGPRETRLSADIPHVAGGARAGVGQAAPERAATDSGEDSAIPGALARRTADAAPALRSLQRASA